jgi:CBS domain-containing protein
MSRRFLVIGPDSPLSVAARYLREHLHHRLAVVENRQLIGVLTRTRVLEYLASTHRLGEAA